MLDLIEQITEDNRIRKERMAHFVWDAPPDLVNYPIPEGADCALDTRTKVRKETTTVDGVKYRYKRASPNPSETWTRLPMAWFLS